MKEPKLRFKEGNGMQFPDWEKSKFSDVFDNINNSTFSRDCLNYIDGNVKYIHYGDILTTFDSTVNVEASNVPYVNKDIDCQKYQLLADGDIIVADTAEDDTVGKAVEIVNTNSAKVISGLHTIACHPKSKFASGYLGYYMNSNAYHNQLRPYMQGIKVTSISKSNIVLTNISIPSLPEQQKMASLFTELDTLIQSAEKELEGYRELKQGMLQKMFPKNGETTPEIRFPEFTGDWEQRKLGELGEILTGSTPSTSNSAYYSEDGIPWVTPTDINELTISDTPKRLSEEGVKVGRIVPANTILCTCIASIGKNTLLTVKGSFNQQINSLTPNAENDAYFLLTESELWSNKMKRMAASGTMQIVNKTEFSSLDTLVPSTDEQKKIGSYFHNLDNLISIQQKELDGYKELKKGLLQQMFC